MRSAGNKSTKFEKCDYYSLTSQIMQRCSPDHHPANEETRKITVPMTIMKLDIP